MPEEATPTDTTTYASETPFPPNLPLNSASTLGDIARIDLLLYANRLGWFHLHKDGFPVVDSSESQPLRLADLSGGDSARPGVYVIALSLSGTYYVGETKDMTRRMHEHGGAKPTNVTPALLAEREKAKDGEYESAELYELHGEYQNYVYKYPEGEYRPRHRLDLRYKQPRLALEGMGLVAVRHLFPRATVINAN